MKEEFKNNLGFYCAFTDEGIYYSNKVINKFYPYGSILKIGTLLGALVITDREKHENGKNKSSSYAYNKDQKARIKELIVFAKQKMASAPIEKAVFLDSIDTTSADKAPVKATKEYRKRCNVCGKIYCYTDDDLVKNIKQMNEAINQNLLGAAHAFGGSQIVSAVAKNNAENAKAQIIDYKKCPNCNSTDVTDISE